MQGSEAGAIIGGKCGGMHQEALHILSPGLEQTVDARDFGFCIEVGNSQYENKMANEISMEGISSPIFDECGPTRSLSSVSLGHPLPTYPKMAFPDVVFHNAFGFRIMPRSMPQQNRRLDPVGHN